MKTPNIYARAARRMERDPAGVRYPCWAILEAGGTPTRSYQVDHDCLRFMSAFIGGTGEEMSYHFIDQMNGDDDGTDFIDHSILALCFVAAMLDAGDLP